MGDNSAWSERSPISSHLFKQNIQGLYRQKMGVFTPAQIDSSDPPLRNTPGKSTAPTVTPEHMTAAETMLPVSE